jgi:hypothetical protein
MASSAFHNHSSLSLRMTRPGIANRWNRRLRSMPRGKIAAGPRIVFGIRYDRTLIFMFNCLPASG